MKRNKNICILFIFLFILIGCSNTLLVDVDEDRSDLPEGYTCNQQIHYNVEFHNEKIYALYDWINPEDEEDWSNALWCFSPYEAPKKIAEGKGLQFRVTKDGKLIAVQIADQIDFYDDKGNVLHSISDESVNTEEYTGVSLEQWNDDGSILWCSLKEAYVTVAYVAVDTNSWEITKYDDRSFGSQEYVLNPNTGWVTYSDYPVTLDTIAFDEFVESGKTTILFVYHLMTKEERVVDSSETNMFKPYWSDNRNELVYFIGYKSYSYDMDAM